MLSSQRLLWGLDDARDRLVAVGVPEDGRGVFFSSERDTRFLNNSSVWLIGNSIITRTLTTGMGVNGAGWHCEFVDIDTYTGEFYRRGESNLGLGGGRKNVFNEDFHHGTDGVKLRQTQNLLHELAHQLITQPEGVEIEPFSGTERIDSMLSPI